MITQNPWLHISAEDYEGHMSSSNVGQLKILSEIFGKTISEYQPQSIMLLGCATGNGLEHLKGNEKFIGVDINPDYLELCRKRFASKFPNMNLICTDLNTFEFGLESVDLIHAALVFEYVDVENVIKKLFNWLKKGGCLSVVLQLESKVTSAISETEFNSLKTLQPIHKLIAPNSFADKCVKLGFREIKDYEVILPASKKFKGMIFQKDT